MSEKSSRKRRVGLAVSPELFERVNAYRVARRQQILRPVAFTEALLDLLARGVVDWERESGSAPR